VLKNGEHADWNDTLHEFRGWFTQGIENANQKVTHNKMHGDIEGSAHEL